MGKHAFSYALLPHAGFAGKTTIEEGVKFNLPVSVVSGALKEPGRRIVKVNSQAVNIDAIKKSDREDCIVLRVHECFGAQAKIEITCDFALKAYAVCNLLEDSLEEAAQGNIIKITMKPFEIRTYKLWFQK